MKAPLPLGDRLIGWDAPNDEVRDQLVESYLKATSLPVLSANVWVAGAAVAALWRLKPHAMLLGWLAAITLVALAICWGLRRHGREKSRHVPRIWASRFILGGAANGVAWGMGTFLFYDAATPVGNVLMIGIICGMAAGNVVASFAIPAVAYGFLVPAILLSVVMPLTHGMLADQTLAILWLLYLAIMVTLTRSAHKALAQSVRLGHENAQLAESLAQAKERAEKLARAKSDFLAVMSHEIRTPMHCMLGFSELLSGSPLNEKQQMYLAQLREAGEHLSHLIGNILDFTKIDAERLELDDAVFSLPELVDKVVKLFEMQAEEKWLALTAVISPGLGEYWRGDPHRLRQVLVNLLGNAVKFTEKGSVRLEVEAAGEADGKARLRFTVEDTGPGVSADHLEAIFDPFTQEDPTVTRRHGGTGLGLSISKRLVEAMGGQIGVENRVELGCTFSFTVLLSPAQQAELSRPCDRLREGIAALLGMRILLVDDSPFNRLVVRGYLSDIPCLIDEAESGREALEMYCRRHYDIVLMDIRMPEMDGMEATLRIRSWEAEHQLRPAQIIALSASAFNSDREGALAAGCNAFITKPVQQAMLIHVLHKSLAGEAVTVDPAAGNVKVEPARLHNLLPAFLSQVRRDLPRLQAAVEQGDPAAVSDETHRLRGACSILGLDVLVSEAAALSAAVRDGDADGTDASLSRLTDEINRLETGMTGGNETEAGATWSPARTG